VIYKFGKNFAFAIIALTFFLTFSFLSCTWGGEKFPAPRGLINDFAGIIPSSYKEKMDVLAQEVLTKTGATVTVATFKDIGGAQIDEFANRLYEAWGVGKKGEDRGVMILVALKERKLRIEIGYGLEGVIPDGLAGEIRDKAMVPYLSKGEFGAGLLNGLAAIAGIIAKDRGISLTGVPTAPKNISSKRRVSLYGFLPFLLFLLVFFFLAKSRGRGAGALLLLMLLGGGRGRGSFGGHGGFGGFGGGFGGFGGGMSGGGGASGSF
jgi:uncharacterized protein